VTALAGPIGTSLAVLATAALGGFVAHVLIFKALGRVAQRLRHPLVDALVVEARRPARALCPLLGVELVLPAVTLPRGLLSVLEHAVDLALIAAGAWLVIRGIDVVASRASVGYGPGAATEAKARRINTQYHIVRRILVVLVVVLAVSLMLLTFDKVRAVGASILASAGIAALIGGLAVRPLITNLLAGIQIALTEPIELEDVVIVEGEWGWVEEITFTYVVVRTWDLRRLIVPISTFTEKPVQNWSRGSAALLGAVVLYVDYTTPVPALRDELQRILHGNPWWDGCVSALQVTDATERALELRAIVSAPDADALGNLRADVRERLVDFLQRRHPGCLPRLRAEVDRPQEGDRSQEGATVPVGARVPGDSRPAGRSA
jgi:small-conductance mechanosensitive channel